MHCRTVVDWILGRCQELGLTSEESGQVDAAAVELALLQVLQSVADSWNIDGLTVIADPMFVTHTGQRSYPLPEDFGRFITPRDAHESGVLLSDGTHEWPLHYREPFHFRREWSTTATRPAYFTLTGGGTLQLDPPPDANNSTHYTGIGIYMRAVTPDLLDGVLPVAQAAHLIDMTVGHLAVEKGHPAHVLLATKGQQALGRLVNGNARMRQQFQSTSGRVWRHTRRR
jgi:hypothetical protein